LKSKFFPAEDRRPKNAPCGRLTPLRGKSAQAGGDIGLTSNVQILQCRHYGITNADTLLVKTYSNIKDET
jgi:hypothetical protein